MHSIILYTYILPGVILALGYLGTALLYKKQNRSVLLGHVLLGIGTVLIPFINVAGIIVLVMYLVEMYEQEIVKILSIKIL